MKNVLQEAIRDAASAALSNEMIGSDPGAIRLQMLLHRLMQDLPKDEGYLEVGCVTGESFVSALRGHQSAQAFAVDGISGSEGSTAFRETIARYSKQLPEFKFYGEDFFKLITKREAFAAPIGLYFYDGAKLQSSYRAAIGRARSFLGKKAVVIFENWRLRGARLGVWEGIATLRPSTLCYHEIQGGNPQDYSSFGNGLGCFYVELE